MKEKQNIKRENASSDTSFNNIRNTSSGINISSDVRKSYDKIIRKKPVRVKATLKVSNEEMEDQLPPVILKTCEDLEAICLKIAQLEKEKQKLLHIILYDFPKRKRKH